MLQDFVFRDITQINISTNTYNFLCVLYNSHPPRCHLPVLDTPQLADCPDLLGMSYLHTSVFINEIHAILSVLYLGQATGMYWTSIKSFSDLTL